MAYPDAARNRIRAHAAAHLVRDHRKIWVLDRHNVHVTSEVTVLPILRYKGLILPDQCQRERRKLAVRRTAAFANEPTGLNQVWQVSSRSSRSPALGRGRRRAANELLAATAIRELSGLYAAALAAA